MKTHVLILMAAVCLVTATASWAQSGMASLHGWVAFENVAYVDKQPTAKVELQPEGSSSATLYKTETDEHGFYNFQLAGLGRFKLVITAKGFEPYSADVYITSDFTGNWAVQLKVAKKVVK